MAKVFINYRRQDDAYAAAYLDDFLSRVFGRDEIFRAGRSIPPGEDYERCIRAAVQNCLCMLVVVGPRWAQSFSLDDDGVDWVHLEISQALSREIPVIPVLLSGVSRLSIDGLPSGFSALSKLQYLRFDYRNTDQDLAYIASELRRATPALGRSCGNES